MPPRETYRLTAPVILWWVWLAFVAANVVDWAAQGTSTRLAVHVGAIMLAVTGLVYALGLRPQVVADDAGLTVLNPFRDHRVPWAAVKDVDTADWVLVRTSGDRTIYCWALYVSARARRRANPPPRKSLAMAKLRGVAVDPGTRDLVPAPRRRAVPCLAAARQGNRGPPGRAGAAGTRQRRRRPDRQRRAHR